MSSIWIASDLLGNRHVMVDGCVGGSKVYCSFFYDAEVTDNQKITAAAEGMAVQLGAKKPVKQVAIGLLDSAENSTLITNCGVEKND